MPKICKHWWNPPTQTKMKIEAEKEDERRHIRTWLMSDEQICLSEGGEAHSGVDSSMET